jgi:hypothetical protein
VTPLFLVLSQVLGLVSLVALVWLTLLAFRRSFGWGLALALFSPFTTLAFGVRFWHDVRTPFVIFLASFVPALVLGVVAFEAVGGWQAVDAALHAYAGGRP